MKPYSRNCRLFGLGRQVRAKLIEVRLRTFVVQLKMIGGTRLC